MKKYNGKYSLTENLVNGRGMRLLSEAPYNLPAGGLFRGTMGKTGQVKRLISGGLAELLAHVALGVAIPANVASFNFASSGAKDIQVGGKSYEVKMNSSMATPALPETNVDGDELAEKGERKAVQETASGKFFVEITKRGKNGTKAFASVRQAWADADGTDNLAAAQRAAEAELASLGKTKQDIVDSYTANVDGIIVVNKGIEMQQKMEEMFAAKDPTIMAAIQAQDYGAVVKAVANAVGAVAAIVDVSGATASGAFSGYGDNKNRIGLNATGTGTLHRF